MAECRVYWGSHGCKLDRGHDGPHLCECAGRDVIEDGFEEYGVDAGGPPYYGPETTFWGEDVPEPEGVTISLGDIAPGESRTIHLRTNRG